MPRLRGPVSYHRAATFLQVKGLFHSRTIVLLYLEAYNSNPIVLQQGRRSVSYPLLHRTTTGNFSHGVEIKATTRPFD